MNKQLTSCGIRFSVEVQADDQVSLCHDDLAWCRDGTVLLEHQFGVQVEKNPTGASRGQGYLPDTPYGTYDPAKAARLPITLHPGDRVLFAEPGRMTLQPDGNVRQSRAYWPEFPAETTVKRLGGIVCVAEPPPDPYALRPTMYGPATLTPEERAWIPSEQLADGLKKMPRFTLATPEWDWFRRFTGDGLGGWAGSCASPAEQGPVYGREFAAAVSMQALRLISNAPDDVKLLLARGLAQLGLDLGFSMLAGRELYAKGGHCQGRKMPVILAGKLLGLPQFQDPSYTLWVANRQVRPFGEDDMWEHGPVFWDREMRHRWRFAGDSGSELDGSRWSQAPLLWPPEDGQHRDMRWAVHGYMEQSLAAQVGSCAVARACGLEREFGPDLMEACAIYMGRNNRGEAAFRQALSDQGLVTSWGTSWADQGVCAAAWRKMF